jgi:hypothetical protein
MLFLFCNMRNMGMRALGLEYKNILLRPKQAWIKINESHKSLKSITLRFLMPLLFFSFVASLFGNFMFNPLFRQAISAVTINALLNIAANFIVILITIIVAQILSKRYSSGFSKGNPARLVIYSFTGYLVACVFGSLLENYHSLNLVFELVGLYSILLFNRGIGTMLNIPAPKRITFVIFILIIAGVAFWVTGIAKVHFSPTQTL